MTVDQDDQDDRGAGDELVWLALTRRADELTRRADELTRGADQLTRRADELDVVVDAVAAQLKQTKTDQEELAARVDRLDARFPDDAPPEFLRWLDAAAKTFHIPSGEVQDILRTPALFEQYRVMFGYWTEVYSRRGTWAGRARWMDELFTVRQRHNTWVAWADACANDTGDPHRVIAEFEQRMTQTAPESVPGTATAAAVAYNQPPTTPAGSPIAT